MRKTALAVMAMTLLWTSPVAALGPCHDAAEIVKHLSSQYGEALVGFGLQSNGNLIQVYSSEDNDTWTVVSTTPAGMGCIVASGKFWEAIQVAKGTPMAFVP